MPSPKGGFAAIVEVCGFNDWLLKMLTEYGCRETVLIQVERRSKRKTDRRDAHQLSGILWLNRHRLLAGQRVEGVRRIQPPTEQDAEDRQITVLRKRLGHPPRPPASIQEVHKRCWGSGPMCRRSRAFPALAGNTGIAGPTNLIPVEEQPPGAAHAPSPDGRAAAAGVLVWVSPFLAAAVNPSVLVSIPREACRPGPRTIAGVVCHEGGSKTAPPAEAASGASRKRSGMPASWPAPPSLNAARLAGGIAVERGVYATSRIMVVPVARSFAAGEILALSRRCGPR